MNKFTSQVREAASEVYKDFLRLIFSRKFVRNTRFITPLFLTPCFVYAFTVWLSFSKINFLDRSRGNKKMENGFGL